MDREPIAYPPSDEAPRSHGEAGRDYPSVLAYVRWTQAVITLADIATPQGSGYRVGPLRVDVDGAGEIAAPIHWRPEEIPRTLDQVCRLLDEVAGTAQHAAQELERVLRELGLDPPPPERATERRELLRAFIAELERARSTGPPWHPAPVLVVLRLAQRMRGGDPRIPVTVVVYI